MQKVFIQNRYGLKMTVVVQGTEKQKGLAFIAHGLGGAQTQDHIKLMVKKFLKHNYCVVTFDATHSFGESDGNYENATTTNYAHDLEDVIAWATTQPWYKELFILAGHSQGGISSILFAQKFPYKVKALAPISTVVSGKLSVEAHDDAELAQWKREGILCKPSRSFPGVMKCLKWTHMEDRLMYDVLPQADKLVMPVLLGTGEFDISTPVKHQQILFDAIPGEKKEIFIIKGCAHTPRSKEHLDQLGIIMEHWLTRIDKT